MNFLLGPRFLSRRGVWGRGWGGEGEERQGEVVGISLNGERFESFVFFCFGFYFRMPILS